MARISYVGPDGVPEHLHEIYEQMSTYGPFASLVGAMAHRTPILEHVFKLLLELRDEGILGRRYLELALVTVSKLNACDYCVAHHGPFLEVEGVSAEGVERLPDYEDHPELDAVDKLVVEYAIQVTNDFNRARDAIFERLAEHFTEAQIVELTWRIALCGAFNRFNDVLQLDIETEALERVA
jgi:AhpD family alkylhydroperoxidase